MGDSYGWRSPQAVEATLLLERLRMPDASPWLVRKKAEAVVNFYAELEEHRATNRATPPCEAQCAASSA